MAATPCPQSASRCIIYYILYIIIIIIYIYRERARERDGPRRADPHHGGDAVGPPCAICVRTTRKDDKLIRCYSYSAHTHAHARTHVHARTHARTRTRTHTPAHTHAQCINNNQVRRALGWHKYNRTHLAGRASPPWAMWVRTTGPVSLSL